MSDRSDLSFPDDDDLPVDQDHYDEDLQDDQYHNEDDDSSSGTSEDVEETADMDSVPARKFKDTDVSKLVLCPKHKSGHMIPESCDICAANLSFINDQDIVKNWQQRLTPV